MTAVATRHSIGGGNDGLVGLEGNDTLLGGAGKDTMNGGADDDGYYITDGNHTIQQALNSGNDLIATSVNLIMPDNIEDGYLSIAGLTLTGNVLDNVMHGSEGADTLNGAIGNDEAVGALIMPQYGSRT